MAILVNEGSTWYTATWPYPYVAEFTVVYSGFFYAGAYHPVCFSATAYGSGTSNDAAIIQHASSGNNLNLSINSSTGGFASAGTYPYSGTGQAGGTGRDNRWHTFAFGFRTFGANDGDQVDMFLYAPSGRVQSFRDYVSGAKNAWTLLCLGRNTWGTNFRAVNGFMGPAAIYDRILLPHEYQFLYNYGNHRHVPNLKHYWRFDNSGTLPDEIGDLDLTMNGSQGALEEAPLWDRRKVEVKYFFMQPWISLAPNGIASKSHLAGAYTDIDDNPSAPDSNWLTYRVAD